MFVFYFKVIIVSRSHFLWEKIQGITLFKFKIKSRTSCTTGTSVFIYFVEDGYPGEFKWPKEEKKGALTDLPIKYQATTLDGIIPDIPGHENLPPLQLASYSAIPPNSLPKISFQQIYHHMILRRTVDGKEVNNYKGLDRAVKHFEAGDISQIVAAQVSKYTPNYKV